MQEDPIPVGLCQCGCGKRTSIATASDKKRGRVKGEPLRFVLGHNRRNPIPAAISYCECGCGEQTRLVHGRPRRFLRGHHSDHPRGPEYVEDPETGCWIWQRSKSPQGYGRRSVPGRKGPAPAHRVAYEQAKGPIPDGLVIDHLCRNPSCVNPNHLEVVTCAENTRRGRPALIGYYGAFSARLLRATTTLTYAEIGQILGVHEVTALSAVTGRTWRTQAKEPSNG